MIDHSMIYLANGIGIVILIMLRYVASTRIHRRDTEDKLFSFLLNGVIAASFAEILSYMLDGQTFVGARILNYAMNTCLYTVNILLPFAVIAYVEVGLYGDTERIWKKHKVETVVAVFMLAMTALNLFIPVVFTISDDNMYARKPFSYVYFLVIVYFCITALLATLRYQKETGEKPFLNIWFFLLPILIGAAAQFAFYGLSLGWLSSAIGLAGLYMMQQNELAYIDALVDTYNRQYMNHTTSAWINKGRSFAGVMIDVDRFKDINDNFGHSAGDQALKELTDVLKSVRDKNELVFRFAGDEFVVLKLTDRKGGLDEYMERVVGRLSDLGSSSEPHREHVVSRLSGSGVSADSVVSRLSEQSRHAAPEHQAKQYRLQISYGKSFYNGGDLDAFLKEMDDNMYAMKAEHHSGRPAS